MSKTNKEYLFDTYMNEYGNHRGEMQNRITLQNAMAQRGINITVLIVTVLAGLFSFLMKDTNNKLTTVNLDFFFAVAIPLLIIYGILIQLTLATWIYQLSMIFRILRYWNWVARMKVDPLMGNIGRSFLWDRYENPPWEIELEKGIIKYFQPLFLYAICLISIVSLFIVLVFWDSPKNLEIIGVIGIISLFALCVFFFTLLTVHLRVQKATEDIKENIN